MNLRWTCWNCEHRNGTDTPDYFPKEVSDEPIKFIDKCSECGGSHTLYLLVDCSANFDFDEEGNMIPLKTKR